MRDRVGERSGVLVPASVLLLVAGLICSLNPIAGGAALAAGEPQDAAPMPRLVLQITVDQMRGDLPLRYHDRFGAGGFRYLLEGGTWFTSAHHAHAHTETFVGHTTLATGADPSTHGIVANHWFERPPGAGVTETKQLRLGGGSEPAHRGLHEISVEGLPSASGVLSDEAERRPPPAAGQHRIVGGAAARAEEVEAGGMTPEDILTNTFSDELTIKTNGRARVFAISIKDRAAVPLAGKTGKAFWFSDKLGEFVTSTYYYETDVPGWAQAWNRQRRFDSFQNEAWTLLHDPATYLFRDQYENPPTFFPKFLTTIDFSSFPMKFGAWENGAGSRDIYYAKVKASPVGNQLLVEFAAALIEGERLGADEVPDYLSISFSGTDLVGHLFGPASLQSEDIFLHLDRSLADLFEIVDRAVGLDNTLVVLSGDHGSPEPYQALTSLHGTVAGRLLTGDLKKAAVDALAARYPNLPLILDYSHPYVYLDEGLIARRGLDQQQIEQIVADALMRLEGVDLAVASSTLRRGGRSANSELVQQIQRSQHRVRSGDVYVVQSPFWQVSKHPEDYAGPTTLLQHGAPWRYDTFVPIAFAGAGVPARRVSRQVYTVDVAVTLAAVMETKYPAGSVGVPLVEVVDGRSRSK